MEIFLQYRNLCEIPEKNAGIFPDRISHKFRSGGKFETRTWRDFYRDIGALSAGFQAFGVKKGAHASFFSDNRYEWSVTDYALMLSGIVSVPRGSDTPPKEQKFIFLHSDSSILIMENMENLRALAAEFSPVELEKIRMVFLMDGPVTDPPPVLKDRVFYYAALFLRGRGMLEKDPGYYNSSLSRINTDDLATIIYTSGTSDNPKGVMLSHGNFLHNVRAITPLLWINIEKEEKTVSVLPSWHVYERTYEYCTSAGGVAIVYSSVKNLAEDLKNEAPELVCSVPRVWESIYDRMMTKINSGPRLKKLLFKFFLSAAKKHYHSVNFGRGRYVSYKKIPAFRFFMSRIFTLLISPLAALSSGIFAPARALMGGKLRASFSGGGSLPPHIDLAFNAMGIRLVNAYGMTETSPGTITRRLDRNTIGSIGIPLDDTEVRIIKEDGRAAAHGEKGVIHVRGPQVMKGYYKNETATRSVLSEDGWLDTGDVAALSFSGDIVMTGRAKSTIVLLGGENLEPEPIEEKLKEFPLVEHAVVIGQDKKSPVALISVNEEKLRRLADKMKISWDELVHRGGDIIMHSKITREFSREISRLISRANGFKPFERIKRFVLIRKKFSVGEELTQTLKVKRKNVEDKYRHLL